MPLLSGLWGWEALPLDQSLVEAFGVPSALLCLSSSKRVAWGAPDPHAQEVPVLLHGQGWPVGAGAMELGLRLGGAATQARYFHIRQLPPPHLLSPDRLDQPLQSHLLLSQHIRKRGAGGWWPSTTEFPVVFSLYPNCSPGCPLLEGENLRCLGRCFRAGGAS